MSINTSEQAARKPQPAVVAWLLDGDPAIRWQVLHDLADAPAETVAAERERVGVEGWGAQLLAQQGPDGAWGAGSAEPQWFYTLYSLQLLRLMGLDPTSEPAQRAIGRVRDMVTWGPYFGDSPFFEGEVEPCINGATIALGGYFGMPSAQLAERLLGEQLADGGWNCEAERGSVRSSFHTTICVLEGLLAYEHAVGTTKAVTDARTRAHEYLLERRMFRSLSTGAVIDADWTQFSFPTLWHYDVLRGLEYLRSAGVTPDERVAEAIELVRQRQNQNGRWPLQNPHPERIDLQLEGNAGTDSRWNTLRALRVLKWYAPHS